MKWLPRETAPRDGSVIVALSWTMHDAPNGPYPDYHLIQWDEMEDEGWLGNEGLDPFEEFFTHWAPLPKPPEGP